MRINEYNAYIQAATQDSTTSNTGAQARYNNWV